MYMCDNIYIYHIIIHHNPLGTPKTSFEANLQVAQKATEEMKQKESTAPGGPRTWLPLRTGHFSFFFFVFFGGFSDWEFLERFWKDWMDMMDMCCFFFFRMEISLDELKNGR